MCSEGLKEGLSMVMCFVFVLLCVVLVVYGGMLKGVCWFVDVFLLFYSLVNNCCDVLLEVLFIYWNWVVD